MNIRRFIAATAAVLLCAGVFAQNDRPTNWFIGAGGGLNIGFDGKDYNDRPISHSGNGTALDIYAGKYFGNVLGFRAGYQGLKISDQYIDYGQNNYSYIHGDLLFRVFNFLVPYAHAGYAKVTDGSLAGGAGLLVPIKIGKRINVIPDFKATFMNGTAFPAGEGLGRNLSGTLGLQLALGKIADKVVEEPVEVFPPIAYEPAKEEPKPEPEPVKEEPVKVPDVEEINKAFQAVVLFDFDSAKLTAEAIPVLDKAVVRRLEHDVLADRLLVCRMVDHRDVGARVLVKHQDRVEIHVIDEAAACKEHVLLRAVFDEVEVVIEVLEVALAEVFLILRVRQVEQAVVTTREIPVLAGTQMVEHGVAKERIDWKGFGESRPVDTNETAEGRHHNRRIELKIDE